VRALLILFAALPALAHEPEDLTAPVLVQHVEPMYPPAALKAGLGGTVSLEITVAADGTVAAVKLLKGAGFGLDEAALEAARKFRFKPATHDGQPIASTVLFDQKFVLRPHFSAESAAPSPEPVVQSSEPIPQYQTTVVGRGAMSAASSTIVRNQDFELRAPDHLLQLVPGLLTAQHQGGGKADQLFLRGFDADHGTDVAVFVDGVPINLPSHAHGQGYTDLHWIIPEAIDRIEVQKGSYDARLGDFATAGAVNLVTRDRFDQSSVALTVGGFPTLGCSGGADHCKLVAQERWVSVIAPHFTGWAAKLHPWVAFELARDQGPFVTDEKLQRYILFAKLAYDITPHTSIGVFVQAYGSGWIGSGQLPSREVDAGKLDRFGSVDPTEGGLTQRQMLTVFVHHRDPANEFDATVYVTRYRLSLWNDFTFFLRDPVNGDEIEQDDARTVTGFNLQYHRHSRWRSISFRTTVGATLRWDGAHVDLWDTAARRRLGRHGDGSSFHFGNNDNIDVLNLAAFAEEDVQWTRWLRSVVGLRADYFGFNVDDQGAPANSGVKQKSLLSPKASIVLVPHRALDLYLNFGMGFHSNDARIAVQHSDVVPRIYTGEIGARFTWKRYFSAAAAFWVSYLESETVFVGDDAAFEPSSATRRLGFDFELRAQPASWLLLDLDLAQADAQRYPDGGALALAPRLYVTAGLTAMWRGLRAGLRMRFLGDRPAFDESSDEYRQATDPARVNTTGWVVFDLYGAWRWRWLEAGLSIMNLFDTTWREAQVGNHSCTRDETYDPSKANYLLCGLDRPLRPGVTDVHFTPGAPFNLQVTLRAFF
jgi:TonB family protein